jgi:hypothetical protein
MIVANLATYPPRRARLPAVVRAVAPQVDRLNVVLNEYDAVPDELPRLDGVVPILPPEDTKDTGKFLPDVTGADEVFLIDDDLDYPPDYVSHTLAELRACGGGRVAGGYHGSIYVRPRIGLSRRKIRRYFGYGPDRVMESRKSYNFFRGLPRPVIVDQVGTGTAVMRGADMPPFAYMADARMFVDVRLARWCFEQEIPLVCLPRADGWLTGHDFDERIYDFTRTFPAHVVSEVSTFAFRNPRRGTSPARDTRGARHHG